MTEFLRSKAAAKVLGITTRTLINWADRGLLHPIRLPTGGERRWNRDEVEKMRREITGEANDSVGI